MDLCKLPKGLARQVHEVIRSLKKARPQQVSVPGPVARVGQLVRAAYGNGGAVALTWREADAALDALEVQSSKIEEGIAEAVRELDGAQVEKPLPTSEFRQAGRSFAMGPIYDFSDVRIRIDGFSLIGRYCVTICVAPKALPGGSDRSHSKFWLRLRVERGPGGTAALSRDDMHAFARLANRVSEAGFRALRLPYEEIVSKVAKGPVSISLQETISVFIANAGEDEPFETLFSDMDSGDSSDSMPRASGSAARKLLDAAVAVLPEKNKCPKKKQSAAQELKSLGDDLEYFNYENVSGYRGVVVARWMSDHANLVGIAKGPQLVATARARSAGKSENPANRVSASIIVELASRF